MTLLQIALWAFLLVAQNACFTWTSRARNSGSDWYHALAAVFSNGVWFAAFFYTFAGIEIIRETGDTLTAVGLGALYIVATVVGSVTSGWFLRTYVEKGKRRVGHYAGPTEEIDFEEERAMARVLTGPASAIYRVEGPDAAAEARRRTLRKIDLQEYVRERDARARRYGPPLVP